ncbi:MAG TPA: hypothetical protein VN539_04340 [Candidatus Saccharimonadales bacterium]|nr:hypothetical protein [Candidatus Saccharimonadales bacterium]
MEAKNLTFPGGLILGAGLMYLLDPERNKPKGENGAWGPGLQCLAGVLGVAAVAYASRLFTRREQSDAVTAFDLDAPKYAWLR